MVKPTYLSHPSKAERRNPLKWWRGFLGALLTFLFVVPYMMGADVEKYLRGWMEAVNQRNGNLHLELAHYQRHWFTSDGDLVIAGGPLHENITVHFIAYHGPLFFNAGSGHRLGLSFIKGTIDSNTVLGPQTVVKIDGPIQLTAFVPYFRDRELHTTLPPITLTDKENGLIYLFKTVDGNIDGDGLLQMELPSLKVSRLNGNEVLDMDAGLLRILPDSQLASFSAKQINLHLKENNAATISNFVMQANTQNNKTETSKLNLDLNIHFDQFKKPLNNTPTSPLLEVGPFELKLGISGLRSEGLLTVVNTIKAISTQSNDLTPEQGEALEKGLSNIFSPDAVFDLSGNLSTSNGKMSAEFQGGFKSKAVKTEWQGSSDLFDAFYSKGSIKLDTGVAQALSQYAASQPHPQDPENIVQADLNSEDLALPLMLGFLKQGTEGYSTQIDVRDGRIILNGADIKKEASHKD